MSGLITNFIHGSKNQCTDDIDNINLPLVVRGVATRKQMRRCREIRRDFYYIDTGYFGNFPSPVNPSGHKIWHRVVKNEMQHCVIIPRKKDRWQKLVNDNPRLEFTGWKNYKEKILLVLPNEKACLAYNMDRAQWLKETIEKIKRYSSLPIELREKASRSDRNHVHTIYDEFDTGVYATVTFNSIAAIESILYGIPAFVTVPCAASPLANNDLSSLTDPFRPSDDLILAQAKNLAYGQFTSEEIESGEAWKILQSSK